MVRKPKKSMEDKLNELKSALVGDMPWMADCDAEVEHELEVEVDSISEHHDAGPDGDWSCFRVNVKIGKDEQTEIEVPFWAMSPFLLCVIDRTEHVENGWLDLTYVRTIGDKGRNQAQFE